MRLRSRKRSLAEGSAVRSTQSSSSTKRNGASVSPCRTPDEVSNRSDRPSAVTTAARVSQYSDMIASINCCGTRYGSSTDCRRSSSSRLKSFAVQDISEIPRWSSFQWERRVQWERKTGRVLTAVHTGRLFTSGPAAVMDLTASSTAACCRSSRSKDYPTSPVGRQFLWSRSMLSRACLMVGSLCQTGSDFCAGRISGTVWSAAAVTAVLMSEYSASRWSP
uniref:Uncharacterized protein n=2 Tax=Macrostomum lignano TaxID=282301 RepID=A0A1I8JJ66_9PLAT